MSTIAFSNTFGATRDEQFNNAEIFLLDPDGTNPRQLTDNQAADAFPTLSPNGKRIVFDSNRLRGAGPLNTSDLFVMNTDGTEQTHLIRAAVADVVARQQADRLPRLGVGNRSADPDHPRFGDL